MDHAMDPSDQLAQLRLARGHVGHVGHLDHFDLDHGQLCPRMPLQRRFWLEFSVLPYHQQSQQSQHQHRHRHRHHSHRHRQQVSAATSFPQFGRLPAELRIMVWKFALRQRRVVVVTAKSEDFVPTPGPAGPAWTPPPAEIPALMRVCRESHDLAVRFYERAFAWRVPHVLADESSDYRRVDSFLEYCSTGRRAVLRPAGAQRPGGPGCWFNFAGDSLLLRGDLEPCYEAASASLAYFVAASDAQRVEHVAVDAADLGVGDLLASQLYARLFPVIDRFAVKQCLTIVQPCQRQKKQKQKQKKSTPTSPYEGDMNGLDAYDLSNNICQQVWDHWTASAHTDDDEDEDDADDDDSAYNSDEHVFSDASPSTSGSRSPVPEPESESKHTPDTVRAFLGDMLTPQDAMRVVMVPEDQLHSTLETMAARASAHDL